ncbi:FCRL5 protein, partial [Nyctiprogne leucopyga]|nr:FCRL5 protein [Nyctiprogne leucopyga]
PPPPNITVTPEKIQYLLGDTISIRCAAPWTKERIQGFQFLGTSGWAVDVRTTRRTYTYSFNVTGPKDGGAHACTYSVTNRFRRPVRSQESRSIFISVRDRPPQPTLTLNSSTSITIEGQPIVFFCAAPAGDAERRFHFYKEKVEVTKGVDVTLRDTKAWFQVVETHQNHTGNFTCGYEENVEGRWIPSYRSCALEVIVKEPASPPRLEVDPPTGVVSEDHPFHLTCMASRGDFKLRFRFYRNGVEIPPEQPGASTRSWGNASEFFFSQSPRSFGGTFSCMVEEEVGRTWVASPHSEAVEVTVKGRSQLLPLVACCVAGTLMLLLGLLLAVCLCRRRGGVHWKGLHNKDDPSVYPMANVNDM